MRMFSTKCVLGCEVFDHSFKPRDEETRLKWKKALRLPHYFRTHRVCDRHFPNSAFLTFKRSRITLDAVPSLDVNTPAPKIMTKDSGNVPNGEDPTAGVGESQNIALCIAEKSSSTTACGAAISDTEAQILAHYVDPRTFGFFFQQTMYRIKDPRKSLPFYSRVLGMTLLLKQDFPATKFTLYFFGYEPQYAVPSEKKQRILWAMSRKGTLQLTHNWGTENDPYQNYHTGNFEPRGYGHIGVMVPDVYAACKRFEQLGVEFMKKPDEGRMKGLAFIKDPDGYWIQIFNAKAICQFAALKGK